MGQTLSTKPVQDKAEEAQNTIDLADLSKSRGPNAAQKTIEVTGVLKYFLY